jgi:hypothetical protein
MDNPTPITDEKKAELSREAMRGMQEVMAERFAKVLATFPGCKPKDRELVVNGFKDGFGNGWTEAMKWHAVVIEGKEV